MRQISFALTTRQFLDGSKSVTRRLGWANLKVGERLMAIEKGQGLKKGEKIRKLGEIEVVSVGQEKLNRMLFDFSDYGESEVVREGFSEMSPWEFVEMFCKHNHCDPSAVVTRIEFKRIGGAA